MEAVVDKHEISFQAIVVLSLALKGVAIERASVGCVFPMGPCVFVDKQEITTTSETVMIWTDLLAGECVAWGTNNCTCALGDNAMRDLRFPLTSFCQKLHSKYLFLELLYKS